MGIILVKRRKGNLIVNLFLPQRHKGGEGHGEEIKN